MALSKDRLAEGISLYVHIPFCKTKCPYCDFNTYQGIEAMMAPYLEALVMEVSLWGNTLGRPRVNTIFFGGGTPSYVPSEHVQGVLQAVADSFEVVPGAEITLEANPGDLNEAALARLLDMGVNRLSIGVQSLDNTLLSLLGRRHTADEAVRAYRLARQAGFDRVNLDLMYGLPYQTMSQWKDTLQKVEELEPPHLSLYCLTLEEGTPLEKWVSQGRLPAPDPDLAADMYLLALERLGRAGYHHYEISNWCTPGFQCLHNLAYWLNLSYLGVGPGAHSCLHGHRFWDVASPRAYIQKVKEWEASQWESHQWDAPGPQRDAPYMAPVERLDQDTLSAIPPVDCVEPIGPALQRAETMFLGLRLLDGLNTDDFKLRYSQDSLRLYGPQIEELIREGLLEHSGSVLRLTEKGCLLANQVFIRFLP